MAELMGESFSLCPLRMTAVCLISGFSCVDAHVLVAAEPPLQLLLLFSYRIDQFTIFRQLCLAGARIMPVVG